MNNNYNNYNTGGQNRYPTQTVCNNPNPDNVRNFNEHNYYQNRNNYNNHNNYNNSYNNSYNDNYNNNDLNHCTVNVGYKTQNHNHAYNTANAGTTDFVPNCGYGNPANSQMPFKGEHRVEEHSYQSKELFKETNKIEAERNSLRKTSNKIGGGLLIFEVISNALSIFLMFPLALTGAIDETNPNYAEGFEPVAFYILNAIVCLLGFGVAGIIITKICRTRLDDVIKIKKTSIADTAKFVMAGMCFTFILNILLALMNVNLSIFGYTNEMPDYGEVNGIVGNIIYFVAITIVPAIIEEFLFRGVILGTLRKTHGDVIAIIVSSVLFGFIHGNFLQTPITALSGMIMGYLTIRTGSIIPAMILHFVNNSLAVTSEWLTKAIDNDVLYSIVDTGIILAFIVVGLLCAISLIKKYKNDLFNFENPTSELTVSKKLTYIFTSPCMIIFTLFTIVMCFLNSTSA